jgi:exodeoxyribonuclease VIII
VSSFWFDPATGEHSKCRPDWESPAGDGVILLDLKTCQDASPAGFARAVVNFGYHLQAAHYSDGHAIASGKPVLGFVFACVEAEYPHAAAAYMLDDDAMAKARAKNRELAELYAACKAAGAWPGYVDTIQPLSLPAWAV